MSRFRNKGNGPDALQVAAMLYPIKRQAKESGLQDRIDAQEYTDRLLDVARKLHTYPEQNAVTFLRLARERPRYANIFASLLEFQWDTWSQINGFTYKDTTPLALTLASGHMQPILPVGEEPAEGIAKSLPIKLEFLALLASNYNAYGGVIGLSATRAIQMNFEDAGRAFYKISPEGTAIPPTVGEVLGIREKSHDGVVAALERLRICTEKWEGRGAGPFGAVRRIRR